MADLQKANVLDDAIVDRTAKIESYSKRITSDWNSMMFHASLRSIESLNLEVLLFIDSIGESSKVKKHAKKLREFRQRISALQEVDLNSSTYITKVLTPAKAIRKEFSEWKTQSITNIVSGKDITLIETKAELGAEKVVESLKKAA